MTNKLLRGSSLKIALIRHAQSEANEKGLVCGQMDSPLTLLGQEQARNLGRLLQKLEIKSEVCYASTLSRTIQTARLAMGDNISILRDARLNETNTGSYSHLTFGELHRLEPRFEDQGKFNELCYPEGESILSVYNRMKAFADECLLAEPTQSLRIVSGHGGTVNCLLHYFFDIPIIKYPAFHVLNASLTVVNFERGRFTLEAYNRVYQ
jgi:broad specificity phosphatase PhoE